MMQMQVHRTCAEWIKKFTCQTIPVFFAVDPNNLNSPKLNGAYVIESAIYTINREPIK